VWILQFAVLLVAVLRLYRPRGVYLVLAVQHRNQKNSQLENPHSCCKPGRINKLTPVP
jgi:hypothetical protein